VNAEFFRRASAKEKQIIHEIFDGATYIENFLDDIYEIFPGPKTYRYHTWTKQIFITIGASMRKDHYHYMYEPSTGNIYLMHTSQTFPCLNMPTEKPVLKIIQGTLF
jgi:hypothetical protein